MTLEKLKQALPNITDPRLLDLIMEKGQFVTFEHGKILMEPGQFIKAVPLVLNGSIKIMRMDDDGKELFLYYLEQGETCALSLTCCSAARPSEIKAVVEETATLVFIPIQFHEQWMDEYKQWKDFVSSTYQQRFHEMLVALDSVAINRMRGLRIGSPYSKERLTVSSECLTFNLQWRYGDLILSRDHSQTVW